MSDVEINAEQIESTAVPSVSPVKLKTSEKVGYGFGDLGNGFMFDLGQAYLTKFWIDICLIPAQAVAGIFAFTKIFDAFMDPVAGAVIDKRRAGPRGKFRPVMMVSSILLAILTIITFTMPVDLTLTQKILFAYAAYMAWGLVYSFTNIPYATLASVMTRDSKERSILATSRQAGSIGAQLITGICFIPVVLMFCEDITNPHQAERGFIWAAAIMSIVGVLGFAVTYFTCKEHVPVIRNTKKEKKAGAKAYFKIVFTNKPLLAIIIMTLFTISAMNTNMMMMIFFAQYNLGQIGYQPVINGIMMGAAVVGIMFIPKLVGKFGKKNTAIGGLLVGAVANLLNFVIPTNLYSFIVLVSIGYTALAISNGITWAMVSDAIDFGEWKNGMRKEGITYAAFNFSRKISQALAAIVSAGILGITGYIANGIQNTATLLGIKAAMTLYPGIALACAALVMFGFYSLSERKFARIAQDLNNGRWEKGKIE
ncbi:MAG: glycoside-pentoside-hexuronide (GPH):cation symporter [Alphaproteobacteria bacterium]|nr:glycoside-pentoside-hexuronide (GPH):cation symporter [Alphaproteobacteria bacterium]